MTQQRPIAGLDFGMTNSLLCTHEPGSDPVPFRARGYDGYAIPTIIADGGGKSVFKRVIGVLARNTKGFVENFKISLTRVLTEDARRNDRDFKATRQFLEELFGNFFEDYPGEGFDSLVVTVPESWLSGEQQAGVDTLRQILNEIGLRATRFLSEPVAAAGYFAHRHEKLTKSPFRGHALVYDHGGSTLDVSLTRIDGSRIEVVSTIGVAGQLDAKGFGGVQFDRRVLAHIAERSPRLLAFSDDDRAGWLQEFERKKRETTVKIELLYKPANLAAMADELLFSVQDTQVLFGDIVAVFEKDFSPGIRAAIEQVLDHAATKEKIATADKDRFRVVMVGGFSEFYPVQKLVGEIIEARCGTRDVMQSYLNRDDKWLAVAKGACLVAAGVVRVQETCPLTLGLIWYIGTTAQHDDLIRQGEPIEAYRNERYLERELGLAKLGSGEVTSITFYLERAGVRTPMRMRQDFSRSLPDFRHATSWHVGCVVDDSTVILKLRSNTGMTNSIRMGQLLSMVQGRFDDGIVR